MWLLVPLTALWVNLHAGFVAWLATLGLLVLFCAAQRDWSGVRRYGTLAALCSLASLLNPYGWQLHLHIVRYLNSSWILDHVQEFQSPHIRSESMIVFALLLLATVALVPQADRFEAVLVLVWGFLALRSARHVPFFAIAAAPVLASAIARYWARLAARAGGRSPLRIFWELAQEFGRRPRASVWLPLSAAVVMRGRTSGRLSGDDFPGAGGGTEPVPTHACGRHAAHPDVRPMGRLPDLPPVPATARLLRRAQRFLSVPRSGRTTASCWRARVPGANCWTVTGLTWRCCRTIGR